MNGAVISLCDRTGNMVKPWADAGYECWCFDVQHSIRRPRREGNINFVWGDIRTVRRPTSGPIAFVFCQSPCTHVAGSGARDFATKGGQMLRDTLEMFEAGRQIGEWSGSKYMMENPVGVLSSIPHIGTPDHYFHPWHYTANEPSDNYTKNTCIWGGNGFVMPPRAVHPMVREAVDYVVATCGRMVAKEKAPEKPGTSLVADWYPDNRIHLASPSEDRGDIRSAAPMGFARAMFTANAPEQKRAAA